MARKLSVSEQHLTKQVEILVKSFSGLLEESASDPPRIQEEFADIIQNRKAKRIICGLTNCVFMGADELGALVWTFAECHKQMLQIRYVVPQGGILDKLMICKLHLVLRIFDTVEDALESF